MKHNLVLQSFGSEKEYLRAIFCIWSFYAHVDSGMKEVEVLLFTDHPHFFESYLGDLPVEYVVLSPEKIAHMRGEINFLHRIKIGIIEEAYQRSDGNILYVDGDTFFADNPATLFGRVSEDVSFMHTNEYAFHSLRDLLLPSGATFHHVLKVLQEEEFTLGNGHKFKIPVSLFSWNAGAIILHRKHYSFLADVYAITDQLFSRTGNHACEQFAFSIVLQTKTALNSCEEIIYHYWYRVKKQIADEFLSKKLDHSWADMSSDKKKDWVRKWTQKLPEYFALHPLTLRDNSMQAFNRNEFAQGYRWATRALMKRPFNVSFLRNCLYHTKRLLARQLT